MNNKARSIYIRTAREHLLRAANRLLCLDKQVYSLHFLRDIVDHLHLKFDLQYIYIYIYINVTFREKKKKFL